MSDQSFSSKLSQEELQQIFDAINLQAIEKPENTQVELNKAKESFLKNISPEEIEKYIKEQNISEDLDIFVEKLLSEALLESKSLTDFSEDEFASFIEEKPSTINLLKANRTLEKPLPIFSFAATSQEPSCEDKMIAWTTQFAIECLITVLTAVGIRFRNNINWSRVIERLMGNSAVRKTLTTLIGGGASVVGLYNFFKTIYDQGLLKFVLSEVADLSFLGILQLCASIAIDFIPGLGEAKLLIQLGICAGGAIYVYTQKPNC